MKVGVCEDDPTISRVLRRTLDLVGHDAVLTRSAGEAMRLLATDRTLDVMVLDIGLPDADGRDLCQALRTRGQHAPVLFLTALDGMHDRLAGFAAGGDDYLPKPFDVKELLARLEALSRRGRALVPTGGGEPGGEHGVPTVVLDPARHSVRYADREAQLTPTEYRLLAALTSRPGEVVRRRALVAAAWPDGAIVSENTVDSFVRRVRVKLRDVGSPVELATVRGVGYAIR